MINTPTSTTNSATLVRTSQASPAIGALSTEAPPLASVQQNLAVPDSQPSMQSAQQTNLQISTLQHQQQIQQQIQQQVINN